MFCRSLRRTPPCWAKRTASLACSGYKRVPTLLSWSLSSNSTRTHSSRNAPRTILSTSKKNCMTPRVYSSQLFTLLLRNRSCSRSHEVRLCPVAGRQVIRRCANSPWRTEQLPLAPPRSHAAAFTAQKDQAYSLNLECSLEIRVRKAKANLIRISTEAVACSSAQLLLDPSANTPSSRLQPMHPHRQNISRIARKRLSHRLHNHSHVARTIRSVRGITPAPSAQLLACIRTVSVWNPVPFQ
mmetsp:Transcript_12486/g.21779  ORF Transcript_12486/g.21779 Transcript_12486/m.21779 type:complete len:241 (-) Transcript_12486:70-792(-)